MRSTGRVGSPYPLAVLSPGNNEKFAATITYNYGESDADADNDYNSFVGDLQTISFAGNATNEEWDLWALDIEADLGFAQFISATSFYDRTYNFKQFPKAFGQERVVVRCGTSEAARPI